MNEENYTEQYKGIVVLRKGRIDDEEVWFATVGNQMISDGAYKTKKELIESLENLKLETVCKMILGTFGRILDLTTDNKKQ